MRRVLRLPARRRRRGPNSRRTDDKAKLVARLRESFAFCEQSVAHLDDSNLAREVSAFGVTWTKPALMMERIEDWADHYSQFCDLSPAERLAPTDGKIWFLASARRVADCYAVLGC